MRTFVAATAAVMLLSLTGCGGDDGPQQADDPAGSSQAPPGAVPAAPGAVRSQLVTVMDTGTGPELCLGPVAESYPPQCGGPAVTGWDWEEQARYAERQGDTRWGSFAVTGTWDGETFAVTEAVPAALYDPRPGPPVELPTPSRDHTRAELEAIANDLTDTLPGVQGAYADEAGHVLVDVTYDDGSIQDHVDATYGGGVVVVTSALTDA
ncbi:hypothetical protein [Nocardioides sp.]|uniref:hypothetical protein n=1 Tax=Nocardioides sp. TaxID=35761 RepID=UPI002721F0D2|nr:hypothetical protein [Nocardioides sp.]MDO9456841.1 hypothetical protein [Nocardioides sp.]